MICIDSHVKLYIFEWLISVNEAMVVMELRIYAGNHISDAAPCNCVCWLAAMIARYYRFEQQANHMYQIGIDWIIEIIALDHTPGYMKNIKESLDTYHWHHSIGLHNWTIYTFRSHIIYI